MSYRTLDADRIEATLETLLRRIDERFPSRGLSNLCKDILDLARQNKERLAKVSHPNIWLRTGAIVAIVTGIAGLIWFALTLPRLDVNSEISNVLQGVDAAVNTVALSGAASWFLLNLDTRWRRRAARSTTASELRNPMNQPARANRKSASAASSSCKTPCSC